MFVGWRFKYSLAAPEVRTWSRWTSTALLCLEISFLYARVTERNLAVPRWRGTATLDVTKLSCQRRTWYNFYVCVIAFVNLGCPNPVCCADLLYLPRSQPAFHISQNENKQLPNSSLRGALSNRASEHDETIKDYVYGVKCRCQQLRNSFNPRTERSNEFLLA